MFFAAALLSKADLAKSSYVDVKTESSCPTRDEQHSG